ncbi:unnamed protein product [Microthlaspi erraticum]|uniref:Uncharacterized protein n=1 Tax=Microthlaspi erraticum TaxID=1685480 RepID=A0A6D2KWU1_9BRAS|nr:unnamed protein product [Microthlaspi erraticum]
MAGMNPMMHHHPQGQHALKQAAMGATGSSQAIYDAGFQNAQQLMYDQVLVVMSSCSCVALWFFLFQRKSQ